MRWMKADGVVVGDWIEHRGEEWSVAAHPEPEQVTDPGSKLVFRLSRIDGRQTQMRTAPGEVVKVTRQWKAVPA